MLDSESNITRVLFMNEYKFLGDIILTTAFISVVAMTVFNDKRVLKYCIILSIIGLFTGFRSIMIFPFIFFLISKIFDSSITIKDLVKFKALFIYLIFLIPLSIITFLRFEAVNFTNAFSLLGYRIFGLNVMNVENIISIYKNGDHPNPFLLDFNSIISSNPGFSGYVTSIFNKETYDTFQLTPTIFGEAYALVGNNFWYLYPLIIIFLSRLIFIIYIQSKFYFVKILIITCFTTFILSLNQGVGTFLFLKIPQIILSLIIFVFISRLRFR